jgi:ketosteroid isomerase-like protein
MSEENVEIVRRLYERWSRGDAALDLLDPELELAMPVGRPDEQRYHGHAGFNKWVSEWIGAWQTHRVVVDRYIDAGEHIVVPLREVGTMAGSSAEVSQAGTAVLTLRDGRVIRYRGFLDHPAALRAAGLDE